MAEISIEAKRERAAYMREYRKRNPEKTREINRRYWQKKADRKKVNTDAETTRTEP